MLILIIVLFNEHGHDNLSSGAFTVGLLVTDRMANTRLA